MGRSARANRSAAPGESGHEFGVAIAKVTPI